MKRSNFLGKEINSGWRNVTAQERVNCYLEITPQGEKQKVVAYGTPGLTTFCNLGAFPVRGGISANGAIYCVVHSFFYKVDNAGTATQIGSISTDSGFVSMSSNGLQILISDGSLSGYIYTFYTGLLTLITDADYPAIRTNCFVDGYFVGNEINTGKYYISGLYDGTSWNALDFASAESNPDNIERVFEDHGGVMLLGTYTTEIVGDNGGQDFPFSRIGYPIEWGLMALQSVAKLGDHTCFLARNRMGECQVVLLSGYSPNKVSTPDIESILAKTRALESATAFSYMQNGHQFYQLNTVDNSFLYDLTSDVWTTVKSYGIDRHKANFGFNLVNKIIVSDYANGKLYTMRDDAYTDDGDPIVLEIVGAVNFNQFDRMAVHEMQVDCEVGSETRTLDPDLYNQYWNNAVLLLNFETVGQTTFACEKTGRTFTTVGGAVANLGEPDSGYPALYTSGTNSYIYAATDDTFATGKEEITIECKFFLDSCASIYPIFDSLQIGDDSGRYTSFLLYINAGVPTLYTNGIGYTFGASMTAGGGVWNYGEWVSLRFTASTGTNGNNKYINVTINNTAGTRTLIGWDMTSYHGGSQGAGGINVNAVASNLGITKVAGYMRKFAMYRGVAITGQYDLLNDAAPFAAPEYPKDPQIMLQTSKDFGKTWGTERFASLGKTGEFLRRVRWSRLGRAYAFTFKLKISDPIKRAIIGVYLRASE